MSQQPYPSRQPQGQPDDLQFDTAEPAGSAGAYPGTGATSGYPGTGAGGTSAYPGAGAASAVSCVACGRPITDVYYAAGDRVVCPQCRDGYVASLSSGSGVGRLLKAALFGFGAGLVGAAIWWAVSRFLNAQVGLIAILVGFMVGGAVRAGSGGRGGVAYQLVALLLTYACISLSYAAQYFEHFLKPEFRGDASMAIVVIESIIHGFIHPFARGASGILGLLIIGFALWQAWVINRAQPRDLAGPYAIAGGGGAPPLSPPPPAAPGVR